MFYNILQIINQISLTPVQYLKLSVCFMICHRKSSNISMIRNCDGSVPPLHGTLNNILHICHAIHIAHLCMTVKLHPLFYRRIHALHCKIAAFPNSNHRSDRKLPVKSIDRRHTLKLHKCPRLDMWHNIGKLLISGKHLYCDRICKIRHIKN